MSPRAIGIVLAFAGAVMILVSMFSNNWLRRDVGGAMAYVGLRGVEMCSEEKCASADYDDVLFGEAKDKASTFRVFANITYFAGIVAALALLAVAGAAAANKWIDSPFALTSVALLLLAAILITGPVTIAVNPFEGFGTAWAFVVFGAGVVSGVAGDILIARARPEDEDWWE